MLGIILPSNAGEILCNSYISAYTCSSSSADAPFERWVGAPTRMRLQYLLIEPCTYVHNGIGKSVDGGIEYMEMERGDVIYKLPWKYWYSSGRWGRWRRWRRWGHLQALAFETARLEKWSKTVEQK